MDTRGKYNDIMSTDNPFYCGLPTNEKLELVLDHQVVYTYDTKIGYWYQVLHCSELMHYSSFSKVLNRNY